MIRIVGWDEFQAYKDREPKWIKLHRRLVVNPKWGALEGDTAKLLINIWCTAAMEGLDGTIEGDLDELAWKLREDPTELSAMLQELSDAEFVQLTEDLCTDLYDSVQASDAPPQQVPGNPLPSHDVQIRTDSYDSVHRGEERRGEERRGEESTTLLERPAIQVEAPYPQGRVIDVTDSQLRQEALEGMGLGRLTKAHEQVQVSREIQELLHAGWKRQTLLSCMKGFCVARERGELGLEPGRPYTPWKLNCFGWDADQEKWTGLMWYGEGKQRTQRHIVTILPELARELEAPDVLDQIVQELTGR